MARIKLRGMTWGHRRAIDPLLATKALFEQRHPEIEIEWASRPLSGFEFTPVPDLARDYDLIVLDHPFCGEIAATGCLLPVDDVIAGAGSDRYVGPSLASYTYAGACWAVPIDAAAQVAVSRPDLLQALDAMPPGDWRELLALGRKAAGKGMKLAIGLRGVHSLMTFFTLCANLGQPCATDPERPLIDGETARAALDHIRDLLAFCPREAHGWNSIELHDVMAARDDLVTCPAIATALMPRSIRASRSASTTCRDRPAARARPSAAPALASPPIAAPAPPRSPMQDSPHRPRYSGSSPKATASRRGARPGPMRRSMRVSGIAIPPR
jgi:multiple sugar transport system substrate-binding protein